MKTLGLTIILCVSVLVMLFLLVPLGVTVEVDTYPEQKLTVNGQLRVAEIQVSNNGWFTQRVTFPELTACAGDLEIPLDAWVVSENTVVPGVGQLQNMKLRAGESGKVFLVSRESAFYDTMRVYAREAYFSCLDPGTPLS